jgi:hypothetical protein
MTGMEGTISLTADAKERIEALRNHIAIDRTVTMMITGIGGFKRKGRGKSLLIGIEGSRIKIRVIIAGKIPANDPTTTLLNPPNPTKYPMKSTNSKTT